MLRSVFPILLACLAVAALPAAAPGASSPPGPSGQFVPSPGDRDGDGVADASDCAPDDPTRPGVAGSCSASVDAASSPEARPLHAAAVARQALDGAAVVARDWRLGEALAVFTARRDAPAERSFVFVALDACGLTVTHRLDDGHTVTHRRSLARGGTYVLRVAVGVARRLRIAVTVVDASGASRRVARTQRLR